MDEKTLIGLNGMELDWIDDRLPWTSRVGDLVCWLRSIRMSLTEIGPLTIVSKGIKQRRERLEVDRKISDE